MVVYFGYEPVEWRPNVITIFCMVVKSFLLFAECGEDSSFLDMKDCRRGGVVDFCSRWVVFWFAWTLHEVVVPTY